MKKGVFEGGIDFFRLRRLISKKELLVAQLTHQL